MAYITADYYKTDYLGNDPADNATLNRYIVRASDLVDLLTNNVITDITDLTTFQQKCVKKATAAFTEWFVENGDVFSAMKGTSESIGSWSQTGGNPDKQKMLSPTGLSWLYQSGLIDDSVRIGGHTYVEASE